MSDVDMARAAAPHISSLLTQGKTGKTQRGKRQKGVQLQNTTSVKQGNAQAFLDGLHGVERSGIAQGKALTVEQKQGDPSSAGNPKNQPITLTIPGIPIPIVLSANPELLLASVESKLNSGIVTNLQDMLKADQTQRKETHDRRIDKLHKALKKAQSAKHKSLFSKIFGWVAAALAVVVGAIVTVFAPPLGITILVGAALAITIQALSQTGEMTKFAKAMGKAMKSMFDSLGVKAPWDEKAGEICAQVLVAVVTIAVDVVMMVASGGAAAEKLASDLAMKIIKAVKIAGQVAQISATVASTGLGVSASVDQYQEGVAQSEGLKLQALLSFIQANDKHLSAAIKDRYESDTQTDQKVSGMLKAQEDSASQLVQHLRIATA